MYIPKSLNTPPQSPNVNPTEHLWTEFKSTVQSGDHLPKKNILKNKNGTKRIQMSQKD